MTLTEALELYRRYAPDVRDSTVRKIRYELNRWSRLTNVRQLTGITLDTIAAFRSNAVKAGLSPRTIETNIDTVHLLLETARAMGGVDLPPPPKGRRLKARRPEPKPVTVDEIESLCRVLHKARWPVVKSKSQWWHSWMTTALWTGIRLTDITWNLGPEHFREDRIEFSANKTGRTHIFPRHDRITPDMYFMLNRPGRSPKILRRQLTELCDAAGIRRILPKNFRQASVTLWSIASPEAGMIVHGCGLPKVMSHYLGVLNVLTEAAPRFPWPEGLRKPPTQFRQLTLF